MGSPLAPVLANLFMGFHEQIPIEQTTNVKASLNTRHENLNTKHEET